MAANARKLPTLLETSDSGDRRASPNEEAKSDDNIDASTPEILQKQDDKLQDTITEKKSGFFAHTYQVFRASYAPIEDPKLVLPTPPTDEEKYAYLHTNRKGPIIFEQTRRG